jgi:hypothetical protein
MSSSLTHIGGLILNTLPFGPLIYKIITNWSSKLKYNRPPLPISKPISLQSSKIVSNSGLAIGLRSVYESKSNETMVQMRN